MAIKREFGFDENFNDGFNNGFNDERIGIDLVDSDVLIDGGTGGGGGSSNPIPIVRGCTDPTSINYNPRATVDDGSCEYKPLPIIKDKSLTLDIKSNRKSATILVDGKDVKTLTPNELTFTAKELMTPKIISTQIGDSKSIETYRIFSVQQIVEKEIKPIVDLLPSYDDLVREGTYDKDISLNGKALSGYNQEGIKLRGLDNEDLRISRFGNEGAPDIYLGYTSPVLSKPVVKPELIVGKIEFNKYQFFVQRVSESKKGDFISIVGNENDSLQARAAINFTINEIIKPPLPIRKDIEIMAELAKSDIIGFRTSWGEIGFIKSNDEFIIQTPQSRLENAYVEFVGQGISSYTHDVSYVITTPASKPKTIKDVSTKILLEPGVTRLELTAVKVSTSPAPDEPSVSADITNTKYNLNSPDPLRIPYSSYNTEEIIYTLGKTTKKISKSGSLVLEPKDFTEGVGKYTIYLQPVSKRFGSGKLEKIIINVFQKDFLPGPDITNINYPQNIKGADFKEFDVPFQVSWQSVNTNYIHIFAGKRTKNAYLGQFEPAGTAQFVVEDVLKSAGVNYNQDSNILQFDLLFIPINIEGDSLTEGKIEKTTITFDKGDLKLRRGSVVADLRKSFLSGIDSNKLIKDSSPYLTHYLHLGDGKNNIIGTWGIDRDTLSEFKFNEDTNRNDKIKEVPSLVLKLYEPLATDLSPNDKVWVSKIQSIPQIDQITIIEDVAKDCIPLTPNFALETADDIGFEILDDLVSTNSTTSTNLINEFISSSNCDYSDLSVNFVSQSQVVDGGIFVDSAKKWNWNTFVKYSSATERVENFFYKVKLIQAYEQTYERLTSGSAGSDWTGSISIQNEASKTLTKIKNLENGFDSFEKFLYTSSSMDGFTYPGAGLNELSSSTDSSVTSWYNNIIYSASLHDTDNTSRLSYNIPTYIKETEDFSDFKLFFDMLGQHFDVLYMYINSLSKAKKLEHKFEDGLSDNLLYSMLESMGWDADMGTQSQFLWEYAFGKDSEGNLISTMSGKDRQNQIWRRLLNNLPYLNKHKGTKRALHAALSCYGIPASMLTIMEFGGPKDPTNDGTVNFTFEDRTAAINFVSGSSITIPWKQYSNTLSNDWPNSIEIRLNTEHRQDHQILSGSNISLDILKDTGSLAKVQLTVGPDSASTPTIPFFNDEYKHIVVNRTSGSSDTFEVFVKEGFQGRIRGAVSESFTASTKNWEYTGEIHIGKTFTGSVDEFRLWRTPLSQSRIDNHTLMPDAIDGNHISASTHDLFFRNDFEFPKNRHSSGDTAIKNTAVNASYASFSTASNFDNISEYPFQYVTYDRDVTANIPSSGFGLGNKFRFESQTKLTELSYRQRATKKSFDQAPIDSNKLGLFFSPIKEINLDIVKSLGQFNIDDYIGDPSDEYSHEYRKLRDLRNYVFDRYTLNYGEYIQLVRYIDKSLFETLEKLVPARAKTMSGLLIEPHILERSKVQWTKPTGSNDNYESVIDVEEDVNLSTLNPQYETLLSASEDVLLFGDTPSYSTVVDTEQITILSGSFKNYEGFVTTTDDTSLSGEITKNSGSDMGGISISIDGTSLGASLVGEFDSTAYQQIGMEPDSIGVLGFGLFGSGSHSIRTRIDKNNNYTKERVKVFILKEQYSVDIPQNIDPNDESRGREFVTTTQHRFKVNILPFTGSNGSESTDPSVSGDIVEVTPLNGYFPSHYRNVGDLTSGLENSFFNGSKQTSATTTDGGSPVVTFTTNPNTLRVSDTGRGSGEPILEVD